MSASAKITQLSDVPADTTFLFRVRPVDGGEEREAILIRTQSNGTVDTDGNGSVDAGSDDSVDAESDDSVDAESDDSVDTDGNDSGDPEGDDSGDAESDGSDRFANGDSVAGWLNYCQHFTHITLDKGSGAEMRDGEVICTNHGAYFEADTGRCSFGPCEGAFLTEIDVCVEDGAVYLVDDDYTFVATGGIETDDADLGSTSNYEF